MSLKKLEKDLKRMKGLKVNPNTPKRFSNSYKNIHTTSSYSR